VYFYKAEAAANNNLLGLTFSRYCWRSLGQVQSLETGSSIAAINEPISVSHMDESSVFITAIIATPLHNKA
jgi:hypothetical protein